MPIRIDPQKILKAKSPLLKEVLIAQGSTDKRYGIWPTLGVDDSDWDADDDADDDDDDEPGEPAVQLLCLDVATCILGSSYKHWILTWV